MNDSVLRPGHVAAAALTLGGLLLLGVPSRAPGIVRLVLVTIAAAGAVYALLVHGGPTLRLSPFRWSARPDGDEAAAFDAHRLRAALGGRRHRVAGGRPLPPSTIRLLQPLIEAHLLHEGAGPDEPYRRGAALRRLAPETRAILSHDATVTPPWFRTRRPAPAETARVVEAVLDDLGLGPASDLPPTFAP